jgi:hypothetical protein
MTAHTLKSKAPDILYTVISWALWMRLWSLSFLLLTSRQASAFLATTSSLARSSRACLLNTLTHRSNPQRFLYRHHHPRSCVSALNRALLQRSYIFPSQRLVPYSYIRTMSAKRKLSESQSQDSQPADTEFALDASEGDRADNGATTPSGKKQFKEREYFKRDDIPRRPIPPDVKTLKIISWNIPGLRAAVKNTAHIIEKLIEVHQPDILCLQETKIQDIHIEEFDSYFSRLGYKGFWSCSTTKKGYSGTVSAVFCRVMLASNT